MSAGWATEHLGRLLAERADHARLVRGAELADLHRVHHLVVRPGRVQASVMGTRGDAYDVEVRVPADAGPPHDADDLWFDCTCPDWGDPCKHAIAAVLALAESFESDPGAAEGWWGAGAPEGPLRRDAPAPRPRPAGAAAGPRTPLPTAVPTWAEGLAPPAAPRTTEAFFGATRVGRASPAPRRSPARLDTDELVELLGPVVLGEVELTASLAALLRQLAR